MKFDFLEWIHGGKNIPQNDKALSIQWERSSVEPALLRLPVVVLAMLFLWGVDIYIFEKTRLQYYNVLLIRTASMQFIFYCTLIILMTYIANIMITTQFFGITVEFGMAQFYFLLILSILSSRFPAYETRSHFFRLTRIVFFPSGTVTFPEVLLADALTSLSRSFKDLGITVIAIYVSATGGDLIDHHNIAMILVALLAALPYWIRVKQCSIQFYNANDSIARIPIALNILKYCTAFPPIILAAVSSLGLNHPNLHFFTAVAATVNSTYGFLWDIIMDWGLISIYRNGRVLPRSKFLLPYIFHILATFINLCLRFLWLANQIPIIAALHPTHLLLLVELLEVCRRSMWNVFRVEWEILVQQDKDKAAVKLREEINSSDEDSLLLAPSISHNLLKRQEE